MKRLGYLFIILLPLFASSCTVFKGTVWDDSIPPEQTAKIAFYFFEPKGYNGMEVDKKEFAVVTIPSGPSEFSGDIRWYWPAGNITYTFSADDIIFSYRLEAEKEYWAVVSYRLDENTEKLVWGINMYTETIKLRVGFPPDDKLVAFIPFSPPVITDNF